MNQSRKEMLWLNMEDWRLQQHFRRVEYILRNRDVNNLSLALQQARNRHLDQLHAYAARGIFPRNREHSYYTPCFIDRDGHECAVAHLMMTSGYQDVAYKIAALANYAYIPEMKLLELDDWTAQTGLTSEELRLSSPVTISLLQGKSCQWRL